MEGDKKVSKYACDVIYGQQQQVRYFKRGFWKYLRAILSGWGLCTIPLGSGAGLDCCCCCSEETGAAMNSLETDIFKSASIKK